LVGSTIGEMMQLLQFKYILTFFQVTATHCAHRLSCLRAPLNSGSQRSYWYSAAGQAMIISINKRTSVMKTAW